MSLIVEILDGVFWILEAGRWFIATRVGHMAAVATLAGLLLWLLGGLSIWFFAAPLVASVIGALIWDWRTSRSDRDHRRGPARNQTVS